MSRRRLIVDVNGAAAAANIFHLGKVEKVHQVVMIGGIRRRGAAAGGRLSSWQRRSKYVICAAGPIVEVSGRRRSSTGETKKPDDKL